MSTWDISISSKAFYNTVVEAETEDEARNIAMEEWMNCELNEMEFYDTKIVDICEED